MVEIIRCKDCGWQMHYVENYRKNEFYLVKTDTYVCCNCNKIVEEARIDKRFVTK